MSESTVEAGMDQTFMPDHEKQLLISSLLEFDLPEISEKLFAEDVISEFTKDLIHSLDYQYLDPKLCIRYLLQEVFKAADVRPWETKCENRKWNKFVNVLLSLGGETRRIGKKLKGVGQLLESKGSHKSEHDMTIPLLKEKDIKKLMNVLSKYAYEWESICIALGLPHNLRQECRSGSSNVIRLTDVLHGWIVGPYPDAVPTTLWNLKLALGCSYVGCPNAVAELMEEFNEYDPKPELYESSGSGLAIHPTDATVRFGRSTLLEVQVGASKSVSYQWMRNGEKLYCNVSHEAVKKRILCITKATDSGSYSCCITTGDDSVISEEAYLNVKLPDRNAHLTSKYSRLQVCPKFSWPPISSGTFISIALVMGHNPSFNKLIKSSIDDILEDKDVIEYKKAFGTYTSGDLLLVEGRPGSGKTTLVHKITRDWSSGYSALKGASKVYLITLRVLNHKKKDIELFDILRLFYTGPDDTKGAVKELNDTEGEGVCFILDGLDEYKGNNETNVIQDLILKEILPLAMVIVASRPVGTAKYRNQAPVTKRIEVLGFTRENIEKYINEYPFDDPSTASKLRAHLKLHVNIRHMCYLPVYASMVCYLYMKLGDKIPHTETKMYEHFTSLTIVRTLKRDDSKKTEFISLDHLTGETKEYFEKICELAFNMTKTSEQVIPLNVMLNCTSGSDAFSLGLIVIDSTAELYDYKDVYTFLHLTFQEFLAAFYITGLEDPEQLKEIEYFGNHQNYQVIKFYFGLVDTEKKINQFKTFQELVSPGNPYSFQCAYESQSDNACQEIFSGSEYYYIGDRSFLLDDHSTLYLKHCYLSPLDFVAMGYVMSKISHHLSTIRFVRCHFDEEGIRTFLLTVDAYELCFIKNVQVYLDNKPSLIKCLSLLMSNLRCLEKLDLGKAILTDENVKSLEGISLNNLKLLCICLSIKQRDVLDILKFGSTHLQVRAGSRAEHRFSDCENQDITWSHLFHTFGKHLVPYSQSSRESMILCCLDLHKIRFGEFLNCVSYTLIDCGIDDETISRMTKALLSRSSKPWKLRLDINKITGKGAACLANLLREIPKIKVFSAHCNCIDNAGAIEIADALKYCQTLERIDLQCNAIGDEGAMAIVKAAKHTKERNTRLYLWNQSITEDGMTEVLKYRDTTTIRSVNFLESQHIIQTYPQLVKKALTYCYGLTELKVKDVLGKSNFNLISMLTEELKNFSNLQYLNFEDCSIGSTGAITLVEALKNLGMLKILNIKGNKLYSDGALAIAGGLQHWINLEVLNMSLNMFSSPECIATLGGQLQYNSCLVELDLSHNILSSMADKVLNKSFCFKLQNLNLAFCSIDSDGGISLAEKLENCSSLQKLDLSGNVMGCGLLDIANNLICPNLQVLSLPGVTIDLDTAVALAGALKHCPVLEELDLADNNINSESMKALAKGLMLIKRLKNLHLQYNRIGSEGAESLSRSLYDQPSLQVLLLQNCEIGSAGAVALADVLKRCSNLLRLNLDYNEIGTEGAKALANRLKFCSLRELRLLGNPIEDPGAVELLQQLGHVEYIHLSQDKFDKKTNVLMNRHIRKRVY